MKKELKSEGKCLFCGETLTQKEINRHLAKHLKEKVKTGKPGTSFLVKVEIGKRRDTSPYFLSLWIDGEAKLEKLDDFLRDIWLECCGHLSAFNIPKKKRSQDLNVIAIYNAIRNNEEAEYPNEVPMERKTKVVFCKGMILEYEYDFGHTTDLDITVVNEYPIKADKKIVLLSRNEPLERICPVCKKYPATQIYIDYENNGNDIFCDKCLEKHTKDDEDFYEDMCLPVVNSPRMGVCSYTGGIIDIERDGVSGVSNPSK